ncbi:ATP-dependent RecD-like DNA helicase [bioreactor metagenome]|uniref:ATP-dependent RecD-like DNA helicase n=1 Tax=bioreactor metagenome TaxID=1076179 RepID=A0A644TXA2_9ZZZZ|nr:AAA domain-containing protein [Methanocorpusculum sp.]
MNLSTYQIGELHLQIDNIQSSSIINGSYYPVNTELIDDMEITPSKYESLFHNTANLKILNYLSDCNKLDSVPYTTDYILLKYLDDDKLTPEGYNLTKEQFSNVVKTFSYAIDEEKAKEGRINNIKIRQIGMNILSIHTNRGIYVLAYRPLYFDVANHRFIPDPDITLCKEYVIGADESGKYKESIRRYIDMADMPLLDDFSANIEQIKNLIASYNPHVSLVDDRPHLVAIGNESKIDLEKEYSGILNMYANEETITYPIKAFFGDLQTRTKHRKEYQIQLIDKKVNLDQLLAIHTAMRYPLAYIQGPPGSGKTTTIKNTIITAFFDERKVLFTSYNNKPIDNVFHSLKNLKYNDKIIPFPIIRLGNNELVEKSLDYIRDLYNKTKNIQIYDRTLQKNRYEEGERTKRLSDLLKRYDEILDLEDRKQTIETLLDSSKVPSFTNNLRNRQLHDISNDLQKLGNVTTDDVLSLVPDEDEQFRKYLYYTSVKYIQRLSEPKYDDLRAIVESTSGNRVSKFNKYLADELKFTKFLRIFPIVLTTCISAQKLGLPKPYFDMTIMDEASQCNTAVALVPILRGRSLMLVGDPQQLRPVILVDETTNDILKIKYRVSDNYDYIENSIYKTYMACDPVSDEILLRKHYRCHKKIIGFNNRKYYNNQLKIESSVESDHPLVFIDIPGETTDYKNTAPDEVDAIITYIKTHPQEDIGVVTPFVNQKEQIKQKLEANGIYGVTCGTVHAFQGDEKSTILFSPALTDQTRSGTYDWLKNNDELINVATSRAKTSLVIIGDKERIDFLHGNSHEDDFHDLVEYTTRNGDYVVGQKAATSRAFGVKPFSSKTETAFLETLNHALDNIRTAGHKYSVKTEISLAHVFSQNYSEICNLEDRRFDFVVYKKRVADEIPVLAIELNGREHYENPVSMRRDAQKKKICEDHGLELISVDNSYARRYNYIKDILKSYFEEEEILNTTLNKFS